MTMPTQTTLPRISGPLGDRDMLQNIYDQYNQLPEGEKNHAILKTLRDTLLGPLPSAYNLFSDNKFYTEIKECTEAIQNCADQLKTATAPEQPGLFNTLINKMPNESWRKKLEGVCKPFMKECECKIDEQTSKGLIDEMKKIQNDMAETYLKNAAFTSSLFIIVQFLKLLFVWRDISNANNVLKETKDILPEIQKNIDKLKADVVELAKLLEQAENEEQNAAKTRIARKINLKVMTANSLYVETRDMIGDVKLNIGNCIERLDVRCNEQLMDTMANTVHGIGNALNYFRFGDMVSSGLKMAYGAITAVSFVVAAANLGTYVVSRSTLNQHRETMREIRGMESELKRLRQSILEAENWLSLNELE